MEVAIANTPTTTRTRTTTSNNESNSLRLGLDHSNGVRSPFQREVREWQRVDPSTGALLTGRLEADRWINGPLNRYGKISDSQNIAQPDGTRLSQRKQLEVLQQRTASGALQVIRAQTVQSSSSRWSSKSPSATAAATATAAAAAATPAAASSSTRSSTNTSRRTSTRRAEINGYGSSNQSNSNRHSYSDNYNAMNDMQYNNKINRLQPLKPMLEFTTESNTNDYNNSNDDDDDDAAAEYNRANDLINRIANHGNQLKQPQQQQQQQQQQEQQQQQQPLGNNIGSNRSNFALLNSAPSMKLSNLMQKSSSSISGSSNSSSMTTTTTTTTTTATTMALPRSNLNYNHSSVNNNNNNRGDDKVTSTSSATATILSASSTTTTTATTNTLWQQQQLLPNNNSCLYGKQQQRQQQRQQQQHLPLQVHPTCGKINIGSSSFIKPRVGGNTGNRSHDVDDDSDDDAKFRRHIEVFNATDERNTLQLTPTRLQRHPRKELESFRLYNEHRHHHRDLYSDLLDDGGGGDDDRENNNCIDNDVGVDDDASAFKCSILQRARSISTDDLSTEWNPNDENSTIDEPSEWRRVSKLRRSFQSTATTTKTNSTSPHSRVTPRRPLDLPESSVSVSKIRAELENGRRLTTAMRNNRIDLAALQDILDTPTQSKPTPARRTTFLTAESLKEIRGKLKRLSDESLYKEDFIAHQQPPTALEQIEVRDVKFKSTQETESSENSPTINTAKRSAFTLVSPQTSSPTTPTHCASYTKPQKSHSLESRQKSRDTNSAEWHLRRKSYGFEKMSPPASNSMFRMDASTDSGLGRSSELTTWSPTESGPAVRGTVVHLGDGARVATSAGLLQKQALAHHLRTATDTKTTEDTQKRHSIAVDESQYVRKASQVHLKGTDVHSTDHRSTNLQLTRRDTESSPPNETSSPQLQRSQQKRVEFCKTEVHFAAESGRVNIVETDGKPPPTNNFRRRRRPTAGPLQSLVKGASLEPADTNSVTLPITHFGDDHHLRTIASTTVAHRATLMDADDTAELMEPSGVTVSVPKMRDSGSHSSYNSTSGIDTTDVENDEVFGIRGILKNKPIKPKPYHLGENFDSSDALWRQKLIPGSQTQGSSGEKRSSAPRIESPSLLDPNKFIAEQGRNVERRQDPMILNHSNGYSTKIKVNLGETALDWKEKGSHIQSPQPHSITDRTRVQERMLHQLKEHQKILDEGLKSTSLIIKTMRSASEFDEAMRRLSIASIEAAVMSPVVEAAPTIRSNNSQETSELNRRTSLDSATELSNTANRTKRFSADCSDSSLPALQSDNFTHISLRKQLSQLRHMYDAAVRHGDDEPDDSADEEVKRYFLDHATENSDSGGGTQESSSVEDERAFEYTNSWSRLKARRTLWHVNATEDEGQTSVERTELPKSNVMSIELHSPPQQPPVAKPRMFVTVSQCDNKSRDTAKEPLKIVTETRGARKLREHELSYFGVPIERQKFETKTINQTASKATTPKRTLPHRSRFRDETTKSPAENKTKATNWSANDNRPDLLQHSTIFAKSESITGMVTTKPMSAKSHESEAKTKSFSSVKRVQDSDEEDNLTTEHLYENIANEISSVIKVKPPPLATEAKGYSRRTDLERDERILSEMTNNADQTMKALTDEAALKDQRRRSLTRRNSKPLETIDEKSNAEKMDNSCIALQFSRGTVASKAKRHNATFHKSPSPTARVRTSSQSSVESCPRTRSRSLSSEREYVKPSSPSKHVRLLKPTTSRSSSLESQRLSSQTNDSSGDEHHRHDERLRAKTKRISSAHSTRQQKIRHVNEFERKERDTQRHHQRSLCTNREHQEKSASTTRSTRRERVECATADATNSPRRLPSSRRNKNDSDKHHATSPCVTTSGKYEKHSSAHVGRSSRDHDTTQTRSSKRSDGRADVEKDRDKASRSKSKSSKGHPSRSTAYDSEKHHHQSASPNAATKSHHTSELKNTTSATVTSADTTQTRSKNAQSLNGKPSRRHHQHERPSDREVQQLQQQHHIHSLTTTTTTIAAKHAARTAKDRKSVRD